MVFPNQGEAEITIRQALWEMVQLNQSPRPSSRTPSLSRRCWRQGADKMITNNADKMITNNTGSTALDAVTTPFEDVRNIYDFVGAALEPYGLKLDYERIEATRPRIVEMLQ